MRRREPYLIAMKKAREPIGEARDDYWIFAEIAQRLGAGETYTEGRDTMEWLSHLYEEAREKSAKAGVQPARLRGILGGRHRRGQGRRSANR